MASTSHWGIIDLSFFLYFRKSCFPLKSHPSKRSPAPTVQRQKCPLSGAVLRKCSGAPGASWAHVNRQVTPLKLRWQIALPHRLGMPHTFFPHLQQFPWFKIAPLGHSDISKVPKRWQAGWSRDHRAIPKPPKQRVFQSFQKVHEIVVLIKQIFARINKGSFHDYQSLSP